ncbi:hypothetical protein FS837_001732 [Tulasnella sp. UAMH 9824]|nr:hypothetical protein FS837_001732 [Tulasnella sp. UAMH 9824]
MVSFATLVLAAPVEWESPHQLVPRARTSTSSTKKTGKLSKNGKIMVGAIIGGLFGLILIGIGCSMLRTFLAVRRVNKAAARKERMENSQMKPEELDAVKQHPQLFETPGHQRLDGWNAHAINGPPPPFPSSRAGPDERDVDDVGVTKSGWEKAPPVDYDVWKQGTVVPTMPEPTYTQGLYPDMQRDSGEKAPFKLF